MKITVTAEVGKQYAPFLRSKIRRAWEFVARAPRPCSSKQRCFTGEAPVPRLRDLSIVIVNDCRMSVLHKQFMNVSGTTDVLTFPIDTDKHGHITTGEIYICVDEAHRQSKIRHIDVKIELLLYAIHGLLHLLGHDDTTRPAYLKMHRLEDKILSALGFGPVFFSAEARAKGARA